MPRAKGIIEFTAPEDLMAWLQARTREGESIHQTTRRMLQRYASLLDDELALVGLDEDEIKVVCDALAGVEFDPTSYKLLAEDVQTAMKRDRIHERYGADYEELMLKLVNMGPGELMALADAVERWSINPRMVPRPALRSGRRVRP